MEPVQCVYAFKFGELPLGSAVLRLKVGVEFEVVWFNENVPNLHGDSFATGLASFLAYTVFSLSLRQSFSIDIIYNPGN